MSKVSRFVASEFENIIKDSRESRAFDLGRASGYYELYSLYVKECGKESANKFFKCLLDKNERFNEYLKKLIELGEQTEDSIDKYLDLREQLIK